MELIIKTLLLLGVSFFLSGDTTVDVYHVGLDKDSYEAGEKSGVDPHGGIKMGAQAGCDDGKISFPYDWDCSTDEAECQQGEMTIYAPAIPSAIAYSGESRENASMPTHICEGMAIEYYRVPPISGAHRPMWPVYGKYFYLPPQRWLHSLEHGAIVFLYHPCVDVYELKNFLNLLMDKQLPQRLELKRECKFKYIITPYRPLGTSKPYALLYYRRRMVMDHFDETAVTNFIKEWWNKGDAPESHVCRDGGYVMGLEEYSPGKGCFYHKCSTSHPVPKGEKTYLGSGPC